jgi:hypothetical protein
LLSTSSAIQVYNTSKKLVYPRTADWPKFSLFAHSRRAIGIGNTQCKVVEGQKNASWSFFSENVKIPGSGKKSDVTIEVM